MKGKVMSIIPIFIPHAGEHYSNFYSARGLPASVRFLQPEENQRAKNSIGRGSAAADRKIFTMD